MTYLACSLLGLHCQMMCFVSNGVCKQGLLLLLETQRGAVKIGLLGMCITVGTQLSGRVPSTFVVIAGWEDEPVQCMVHQEQHL